MALLREDAVRKIDAGITTIDEAARVVQLEDLGLRCPHCLHAIEESFTVCPYCLGSVKMSCPTCNAALRKEWKACPYCRPTIPQPTAKAEVPAPAAAAESAPVSPGSIDVPHVL